MAIDDKGRLSKGLDTTRDLTRPFNDETDEQLGLLKEEIEDKPNSLSPKKNKIKSYKRKKEFDELCLKYGSLVIELILSKENPSPVYQTLGAKGLKDVEIKKLYNLCKPLANKKAMLKLIKKNSELVEQLMVDRKDFSDIKTLLLTKGLNEIEIDFVYKAALKKISLLK